MKIESLAKEVAKMAEDLSSMGAVKAAQMVDGILFKLAAETINVGEVVIKGRTPQQKEHIRSYNANVQEYINEILRLQGQAPTSTADGKITAKDAEWLKKHIGTYKSWPELFHKLKIVLEQTQALKSVPPDFETSKQEMNAHYTNQLEKDREDMRNQTRDFTRTVSPQRRFDTIDFRAPNPRR